jgi:hypothetical protein
LALMGAPLQLAEPRRKAALRRFPQGFDHNTRTVWSRSKASRRIAAPQRWSALARNHRHRRGCSQCRPHTGVAGPGPTPGRAANRTRRGRSRTSQAHPESVHPACQEFSLSITSQRQNSHVLLIRRSTRQRYVKRKMLVKPPALPRPRRW